MFTFETKELKIGAGTWLEVSPAAWDIVLPQISKLKVVSSKGAGSVTDEGITVIKRLRLARSQAATTNEMVVPSPFDRDSTSEAKLDIFIKTFIGRTRSLSGRSFQDTISTVKGIIQDLDGIPVNLQCLVFEGKQLPDDATLWDAGIRHNSSITLICTLRGAKPVIYLYPHKPLSVTARLSLVPEWRFSAVYPVSDVENGEDGQRLLWGVYATPDGKLKEIITGLEVSYLYWEAE